jgi:hypothetical protein
MPFFAGREEPMQKKEPKGANDALTRHLLEAVDRVRDDVEKVEFWADAVAGFSKPVPKYEPGDASVWIPTEQATTLNRSKNSKVPKDSEAARTVKSDKPSRRKSSGRSTP